MKTIDLNCDLGEWIDDESPKRDIEIMPFISSCNIACGGHVGDIYSMRSTIRLALDNNVAIGAHPSYPDTQNFGRKTIEISSKDLKKSLMEQLSVFRSIVEQERGMVHHVKPHGALYNNASVNIDLANTVVKAIQETYQTVKVYCQQGSNLDQAIIHHGLIPIYEVFADRTYENDLTLRSRKKDGAIIHETIHVIEHVHRLVLLGKVKTFNGLTKSIVANTLCLHSDTPGAVELSKKINNYLRTQGVNIAPA